MKLALKLTLFLIGGAILVHSINGYLRVKREAEFIDIDMKSRADLLGRAMSGLVKDVWKTVNQERVLELIDEVNQKEHQAYIRWVWLDSKAEDSFQPRVSLAKLDAVIHGRKIHYKERSKNGSGYLYTYVPVDVEEQRPGALELSESLSAYDDYVHATIYRTVILATVLAILSGVIALTLGTTIVGIPLRRLTEKIQRVGMGDLSGSLHLRGHDELSGVATAINTMCEQLNEAQEKVRAETAARINSLEQLRHADRLSTVGRLAAGVAHELGTPLNVVSGRAGLIETGDLEEEEIIESANIIKAQVDRITTIIRQLLDFARRSSPQKTQIEMRQLVKKTLELLSSLKTKRQVTLELTGADIPITVQADPNQIQQVLMNLIMNATQAMPQGGKVSVGMDFETVQPPEDQEGAPGEYLRVFVKDEGSGIAPEVFPHIFEPFFTTKDMGEGNGLGLSIAYGIIQEHGGWIDVTSELGKGSCFSMYLPMEISECPDES
jgi:two-component system NtrC family sensor kinase